MRCVLIGAGRSGTRFLRAIASLKSTTIEVVGVADNNIEKLAGLECGSSRLESDYKELLMNVECDLIIIATNDSLHYEVLKFIIDNNIQFAKIVCEKPLVTQLSHCRIVALSPKTLRMARWL